jgi:hypothetical protein
MVSKILLTATVDGELHQLAEMEDGAFFLVVGGNTVQRRKVFAFEPRDGSRLFPLATLDEALETWADCMAAIEDSNNMLARRPVTSA